MKKICLSMVSDALFIAFAGFLLALFVAGCFTGKPYNIIAAGIFSGLLTLAAVKALAVRRGKKVTRAEREKLYSDFLLTMNFLPRKEVTDILCRAIVSAGLTAQKKRTHLYIPEKKLFVFYKFGFEEATKADAVKAYNAAGDGYAVLISGEFSGEVKELIPRFSGRVSLSDGRQLFSDLEKYGALPQNKLDFFTRAEQKPKPLANILNKKRAKNYLVFGVVFLLMSYFVPIKTYYVVCGSVMLLLALTVRFFGKD